MLVVLDLNAWNHFVAIKMLRWYQIPQPYTPNHLGVVGLIQVLCGVHYYVKVTTPNTFFSKEGSKRTNLTCTLMILWGNKGKDPPEVIVVLRRQFLQKHSELLQLLWQVFFPAKKDLILDELASGSLLLWMLSTHPAALNQSL